MKQAKTALLLVILFSCSSGDRNSKNHYETHDYDSEEESEVAEETTLMPPMVMFASPTPNQIISGNSLELSAKLTDPEGNGISTVIYGINAEKIGEVILEPPQNEYLLNTNIDLTLFDDGKRNLRVKPVTADGRYSYGIQPVIIDRNAPEIKIILPEEGKFFIGDLFLKFTVTDGSGSGVDRIFILINDSKVFEYSATLQNISGDGNYELKILQIYIPQGISTLKISAHDLAGNISEKTREIENTHAPKFVEAISLCLSGVKIYSIIGVSLGEWDNAFLITTDKGVFKLAYDPENFVKSSPLIPDVFSFIATGSLNPSDSNIDIVLADYFAIKEGCEHTQDIITGAIVYLQKPDKSFAMFPSDLKNCGKVRDITISDVNNDGRNDIIVASEHQASTLISWLGTKEGFQTAVASGGVANASSLAAGDFNNDGFNDIIIGRSESEFVSVYRSFGTGEFQLAYNIKVGNNPKKVSSGDFLAKNNSHDIAVLVESKNYLLLLDSVGIDEFAEAPPLSTGISPSDFVSDDLDGDGYTDFAVLSGASGLVTTYFGTKDGQYESGPLLRTDTGQDMSIAAVDIDYNGYKDLAILNPNKSCIIFMCGEKGRNYRAATDINLLQTPYGIAAGKFLGKGTNDLAVLVRDYANDPVKEPDKKSSAVILFPSNGALPSVFNSVVSSFDLKLPAGISPVDFDKDGRLDLLIGSEYSPYVPQTGKPEPTVKVLMNLNENGAFSMGSSVYAGQTPAILADADILKDGYPDIITVGKNSGSSDYEIFLCFNKGTTEPGVFETCKLDGVYTVGKSPSGIFTGNINNLAGLEVLVSNYGTNDLTYYPGGYGSLNSAAMKHLAVGTKPIGVKVFDADYDGFFDIITPLTNNITISYGVDNNDNFLSPEYLNIINPHLDQDKAAPGAAIDFSDMILVDINLDTLYDIIILDRFYEDLYVLLNLGAREFTKPYWFKTGKDPRKVVASDFNNDGCPDLAVMNQTGKTITFFRNELCE